MREQERERERNWIDREIKEAIVMGKHPQNFNRDVGQYYLSHLEDDLLLDHETRD